MIRLAAISLSLFFMQILPAMAKIHSEMLMYKDGGATLEGYLAYDEANSSKRPGIVIVHDWMGLGDFAKKRADEIAKLGYVAFAADIYGKGIRPKDANEAGEFATKYKSDRALLRSRVRAALDTLAKNRSVDVKRLGAMGYCFGGTTVLELARSGADVRGVVSFHGGLSTPKADDAKNIHGKVLALHGADDPFVPKEEVLAFEDEMRGAKVDWQLVAYGGAVHSFTNPAAGNDNSKGAAYNKPADERSWSAMKSFFAEIF
jgi:dienelactone hydrolase